MVLLDWSDKNFLKQIVTTATRQENILDLVFTNNENIVDSYDTEINSKLSDHNTIQINLNIEDEKNDKETILNPYPNKIFEYNLMKGTEEDWIRYELIIEDYAKDFEEKSKEENTTEKYDRMIKIIEEAVTLIFEKKEQFKNPEEKTRRGNRIPKKVRMMKASRSHRR